MSVRRLAALGAALLAVAVLAGCTGGGPAPPQRAWFRVTVLPDGDALLDLHAAGRLRSDADVRALARRLGEVFALPAAVVAVVAVVAPAGRQGDNLGVAGLLGGTALKVAAVAPLAAVPLGLPAAMLLAAVLVRRLAEPDVPAAHEARPRDTGVFW
ncbi:hypothetical protein [Actinomadura sp. 9N215]|uniref:hypothetical protein n=1 Tax=Actinomadura sp. 9N215 TaxID=3375150 RepID=UPI0037921776